MPEAARNDEEQMMTVDVESDPAVIISSTAEETTCVKELAQEETPVTKPDQAQDTEAAGRTSRRSGRAAKKTDPTAWEDRALQTAIEASKAVSRVPSQSQLSRGTSGSEESSNISEIKVVGLLFKFSFPFFFSSLRWFFCSCGMHNNATYFVI